MKVKVSELRPGDRFSWGTHVAVVAAVRSLPQTSARLGFAITGLALRVLKKPWRGAVRVRADMTVEVLD